MIRYPGIIRRSAERIAEAVAHDVEAYNEGRIEQEPAFTDRMIGHIEEAMRHYRVKGITWQAKTLTDHGPNSQEKKYGADFAGVLSVDIEGYQVRKGFLAQAKLVEPEQPFPKAEYDRLKDQADKMLHATPDSYVFLYSKTGIYVVPALAVLAGGMRNPHELHYRSIGRFFEEHLASFIGDRRISTPNIAALEELGAEFHARSLLYLQAGQDYEEEAH